MRASLDDLLVIDLSQGIAGPYCARLLADFGATVIKLEPPEGDYGRWMPPFAGDKPHREKSLFFQMLNLNKQGATISFDDSDDRDRFRQLVTAADVIIESFPPGYLARLGLDYASLTRENRGLIMASLTPFGQTGPYSGFAGSEIAAYATSGIMSISGTRDREPLQHGGFPAEYETGMNGMIAVNIALLARDRSGLGQHIDVSMQDVVLSSLAVTLPWYSFAGGIQGRRLPVGSGFEQVTPCKDGYFVVQQGGGRVKWSSIAEFFGRQELNEERFADPAQRLKHGEELDAIIRDAAKDRTMADLFQSGSERGLLIGIVQTPKDLAACPQLAARRYFADVEHPVVGRFRVPYRLFNLSEGGMVYRSRAPLLGEHTDLIFEQHRERSTIYKSGKQTTPSVVSVADSSYNAPRLPLDGVRVIDISNVFSLPFAAGLLADLGAEVIKVEGPARLDVARGAAYGVFADNRPGRDFWNRNSTFNTLNRGKRGIGIDLRRAEGREVLKDLIRESDVLMENFTPRVMRDWGLDYPRLKEIHPRLIMASCSGYGQQGPYAGYPAQATTQEATHGLAHVTGYQNEVPSKAGQSFVDFVAGWALVMGTTLGLRYRNRFGKGLWVDVAMYQLGCGMVADSILDWEANKRVSGRMGNRHPWFAPQGCYRCKGEDAWCVVGVHDNHEWIALCKMIGHPELGEDSHFSTHELRRARHDEIDSLISKWTGGRSKLQAMDELQGAGVRAAAVFDARDVHNDPHVSARGVLEVVDFPPDRDIGSRVIIGRPWKFSDMPLRSRGPSPSFGADNRAVLCGILGYSPDRYEALVARGVIGDEPVEQRPVWSATMEERVRQGFLAAYDPEYKANLSRLYGITASTFDGRAIDEQIKR